MHRSLSTALLVSLPLLWACDGTGGNTPTVKKSTLPGGIPQNATHSPGRSVHALDGRSGADPIEDEGECLAWTTDLETYEPATGEFQYRYSCAEGGAIAVVETTGQDNGTNGGSYQTVYTLRDGSEDIWDFTYQLAADGETMLYHGVSNDGEISDSAQRELPDGSVSSRDVFTSSEGVYVTDGSYTEDGRFNGTSTFEDPSTPASPDYSLTQTQPEDGSFEQIVEGVSEGWAYHYRYAIAVDGQVDYEFTSDDPATQVANDYAGSYHYNSDGSGRGGYRQLFDDGGILDVTDVISANPAGWVESWTYDDPSTAVTPDQEGSISYAEDGSGTGSVTTHVTGGPDEICDVAVAADGAVTFSSCR